ncbi:hypothetical protein [Sulfuriflexus mobilis]|uniref:hypothetical protein n=1 Tax=Sulfuriflexus mobilis TaxID=1811807 RepID=UPI0018D4FBF9|nr:hypothetical protein [Sulfuriflexus mobilis]
MKMQFKYTPMALAVAALIASPLTFATESHDDNDHTFTAKADLELNLDLDITTSSNNVDVNIEKDFDYDESVEVNIGVDLDPNAYARAVTDDKQSNKLNEVYNDGHNNNANASGDSLSNAAGNIGLNITAGTNNQQDNAAALAVADAEMTFGAADGQAHSSQDGEFNYTENYGVYNNASVRDNVLKGATGNIGVNISAGNSNQQKNNLAAAVSTGGVGLAMVTSDQESDRNITHNTGKVVTLSKSGSFSGETELWGGYEGTSDQIGDLYVDNWAAGTTGLPNHPTDGALLGHSDFDSEAQGAQDLNGDGGALAFNEVGEIHLSGYFSGSYSQSWDVYIPSVNNASLSGNALAGASGNIGVNIASGTGNQQNNSLALGVSTGTGMPGGEF